MTSAREGGRTQMGIERFLSVRDMVDMVGCCEVTPTGALNWIDSGESPVFNTPGEHYRILRTDHTAFLHRYAMFMDEGLFGRTRAKKRILIVDDEPAVLSFIEATLHLEAEYELATASDGLDAAHQLAIFEPDLVVLDIMLPGMDGFEICRRLKSDPAMSRIKVLAVTGFATEENIQKILHYGADDYLAKPLKLEDLKAKVHQLLADVQ
jgi:CheY-like chemotaxis protein